jgi:hypothetical protein
MTDDTRIEVTGLSLTKMAQAAYDLSGPQGLGHLHYQEGGLSDEEAEALWKRERPDGYCALAMDYVKGRACKFSVHREDGRLYINNRWFDHSDADLAELLRRVRQQ